MTSKRQRVILTPQSAREIYTRKLDILAQRVSDSDCKHVASLKGRSVPIAHIYDVSAKTIRDIWNQKTWMFATRDLWCEEGNQTPVSTSQVGLIVNSLLKGTSPPDCFNDEVQSDLIRRVFAYSLLTKRLTASHQYLDVHQILNLQHVPTKLKLALPNVTRSRLSRTNVR